MRSSVRLHELHIDILLFHRSRTQSVWESALNELVKPVTRPCCGLARENEVYNRYAPCHNMPIPLLPWVLFSGIHGVPARPHRQHSSAAAESIAGDAAIKSHAARATASGVRTSTTVWGFKVRAGVVPIHLPLG